MSSKGSLETQSRIDAILRMFGAWYHKFPDMSKRINITAAINALGSIERVFANADPIARNIRGLVETVQALAVFPRVFLFLLEALVCVGFVLCFVAWKSGRVAQVSMSCRCGRKAERKLD